MSEVRALLSELSSTFSLTSSTPDDPWRRVELAYAPKLDPIILQINRCDGSDPLGIEERNEFLQLVEARESLSKRRIVDQIANTGYIVAIDVPEDMEQDGEGELLCATLLTYLEGSCEGLIQIDGTGFFEGEQVAMELDRTFLIRARALAGYKRNPEHGVSI